MEWIPSTNGLNASGDGADEARREILAVMERVNHEFRTPLNQVFGLIDLLLGSALKPTQRSLAGDLQTAARSLLDRLTDVLALTDLEAGLLDAENIEFHPDQLLARVVEGSRLATAGRENRLLIVDNPELPSVLYGDEWRLQRALVHLVGYLSRCVENATIEFSTEVEERTAEAVSVRFELCLVEGPATIVFPDERGAADLTFAKALVRALGGDVDGPRLEGHGIMIQFSLTFSGSPVITSQGNGGAGATRRRRLQVNDDRAGALYKGAEGARRVLLAEDNRVTQAVTRKLLQRRGHEVQVADNGREAVELVKSITFDVVLMDLEMPEMDGVSATREIRSLPTSGPPIIAYTAHVLSEDRRRCEDAGVDGFLVKPVSSDDLFREVERWPRRNDA